MPTKQKSLKMIPLIKAQGKKIKKVVSTVRSLDTSEREIKGRT